MEISRICRQVSAVRSKISPSTGPPFALLVVQSSTAWAPPMSITGDPLRITCGRRQVSPLWLGCGGWEGPAAMRGIFFFGVWKEISSRRRETSTSWSRPRALFMFLLGSSLNIRLWPAGALLEFVTIHQKLRKTVKISLVVIEKLKMTIAVL